MSKFEWIVILTALINALSPVVSETYKFILKLRQMKHDEEMKKLINWQEQESQKNKDVPTQPLKSYPTNQA